MANLPSAASALINASEVSMKVGSTPDTWTMVQILNIHIGRPESREPTTDGGVQYFYGSHDNWIDYEILASRTEIGRWLDDTGLSNGLASERNYPIVYKDEAGTEATLTITATAAPDFNISRPTEGGVKFSGRLRITEEVSSADIS